MKLFNCKTSTNARLVQELQQDLHCAQDNCLSLSNQLQRQEENMADMQTALRDTESHRQSLKEKLSDTNAALAASRAQAIDLNLKNHDLTMENKRLKDFISQMEERSDSQKENYVMVIHSLKSSYSQVKVDNKNLESRMKTLTSKSKQDVEGLQGQLLQTTKDQLNRKTFELEEERQTNRALKEEMRTLHIDFEKQLGTANEQLLVMSEKLKEQTVQLTEERERNQVLQNEVLTHEQSKAAMITEKILSQLENQQLLRRSQEEKQVQKDEYEKTVAQLKAEIILQKDNFQTDLLKYRAEADQMVQKAKEKEEVTKTALDKTVGEIEKLRLQCQHLQETTLSLKNENVVLTKQVIEYKDHLHSEMKEKRQHIEELQQQLSVTTENEERAMKALHKAVEKMKSNQETFTECAQKNYVLKCTIKTLQEDIENAKLAHDRAMEEANSQDDYIKELEDNLQQAANIIIEKDKDIECLKMTRDDFLQKNVKMTNTITEQEKTISELKEKHSREDLRSKFDERQRGGAWPPVKQSNWNNYRRN